MQYLSFNLTLFNAEGVSRKEMRVLEHFCSFEMCLDIEYFVQRETQFFENFGIKENRAFGRHFTCEFGCHGMCWQNNDIAEKMWW